MDVTVLARLGELADRQSGCLTRQQAADLGVAVDELVAAGFAEEVTTGVVRLRAGGRPAYPRLYAAWLELAPGRPAWERHPPHDGVVSHDSALALYRVAGLSRPAAEFTIPAPAVVASDGGSVLHVAPVGDHEWTRVDGLPVTRPARTLLDLSGKYDVDELARMVGSMVATRRTTVTELRSELEQGISHLAVGDNPRHWVTGVLAEAEQ